MSAADESAILRELSTSVLGGYTGSVNVNGSGPVLQATQSTPGVLPINGILPDGRVFRADIVLHGLKVEDDEQ